MVDKLYYIRLGGEFTNSLYNYVHISKDIDEKAYMLGSKIAYDTHYNKYPLQEVRIIMVVYGLDPNKFYVEEVEEDDYKPKY